MAMVMPRARSSGALSMESKLRKSASPFIARVFVIAAVNVVFPWSTCPIVPTLMWGFVRSNFCFAIERNPPQSEACDLQNTRGEMPMYSRNSTVRDAGNGAHERNRTADLLLTMQMLYRLSYVGSGAARGKIGCEQGPYESRGPTKAPSTAKAF